MRSQTFQLKTDAVCLAAAHNLPHCGRLEMTEPGPFLEIAFACFPAVAGYIINCPWNSVRPGRQILFCPHWDQSSSLVHRVHTHRYIYIYMCVCICICIHTYIRMYIYIYISILNIYIYMYTRMYKCNIYIYTYVYTHIHTIWSSQQPPAPSWSCSCRYAVCRRLGVRI